MAITVAALAGVGVLAVQAANSAPPKQPAVQAAPSPKPGATTAPAPPPPPTPPADSGSGLRVVYSLGQDRVWLIDANNQVSGTFTVVPGTISPAAGEYRVQSKNPDRRLVSGITIRNSVIFATTQAGTRIGFSGTTFPLESFAPVTPSTRRTTPSARPTATDTSPASPTLKQNTGAGIRETDADGQALFDFVDIGTTVVVTDS